MLHTYSPLASVAGTNSRVHARVDEAGAILDAHALYQTPAAAA